MTRLKAYVDNPVDRVIDPKLPYVALEHIEPGTGVLRAGVELEGKVADDSVGHLPGDVRFGKLRPYLAKSFLATGAGVGSGELVVLRSRPGIYPRFLWYLTLSRPFIDWAVASSYGVKMPRTSWEALGQFDVQLPSVEEQRRIVDYLDTETARIDELISEQLHLRRLVREHVEAAIDQTVWSGDLPKIRLGRLTPVERQIMYGIVLPGPNVDAGVLLVKGGDVKPDRLTPRRLNRTTAEIEARYARARLRPNDIVYAIRGSIGDAEIVPAELDGANITQDVARITPGPSIDPYWLLFAVKSRRFFAQMEGEARGATIRGINIWSLKRGVVPQVGLDEQRRIARQLLTLTSELELLDSEVALQIQLLHEHRQALITSAVTGGLEAVGRVA